MLSEHHANDSIGRGLADRVKMKGVDIDAKVKEPRIPRPILCAASIPETDSVYEPSSVNV